MTYQGRDPEREARRAGEPHGTPRRTGSASSAGPSRPRNMASPRGSHAAGDDAGEFVLGADGQPLRDRYGRPVRRRPSTQQANPAHSSSHAQRSSARRSGRRRPASTSTPTWPSAPPHALRPAGARLHNSLLSAPIGTPRMPHRVATLRKLPPAGVPKVARTAAARK
nr:hypothetical protein [Corynebacterium guaraldiae]